MLSYNEITSGRCIVLDGQPYEVLSSQTTKKSRQKASAQAKLKNLISGKVVERSFHQADNVEEADISKENVVYLYTRLLPAGRQHWFCEDGNPKNRFSLSDDVVGDHTKFLKQNALAEVLKFGNNIVGLHIPIKIDLAVAEAPPGIRGNTSEGGTKHVVLETGATVSVPLFIEEGDIIKINTETGLYTERVTKA